MSFLVICKFVSWVDGNKRDSIGLDELRLQLFKISSNNNFRELPPSEEGLELHIRRSSYQSVWQWGKKTSQEKVPPVESFGWTVQEESLSIHWTTWSGQSILEKLTKTCSCKPVSGIHSRKCKSCVCGNVGLACLEQCKCQRSC